jgi:peptidoglycan-associated lipoprotein
MKSVNLFFFFILLFFVTACSTYKKGVKSYQQGEYQVAIENLEKALDKSKTNKAQANFLIAESYRLSNRIDEAAPFYEAALQQGMQDEDAQFYYGFALKANSRYKEAREQFSKYLINAQNKEYIPRANKEVETLQSLEDLLGKESFYKTKHLPNVNTPEAEYAPMAFNGELYFTSSRGEGKVYKATGKTFTNIFKATIGQAMEIVPGSTTPLGEDFNSGNRAEGAVVFSPDGNTMVFARGNAKGRKGGEEVNLYMSYFRGGKWSEPQIMRISDPRSWDSTPAFSKNGKTLYFASNRRGGHGGVDLYSSTVDARGNWGRVQNMGPDINTRGNEMFPFVTLDGRLYFASDGHPSLGGLDLFVAVRRAGKISIENLGVPMNSSADDFGLSYMGYDKGYFSSSRESGAGDDDIYAFINEDPDLKIVNYYLVGTTYTTDENNQEVILPNTEVRLLADDDRQVDLVMSDAEGKFQFTLEEGVVEYVLIGQKENFFTTRKVFPMEGKYIDKSTLTEFETDTTFYTSLTLDKIVLDKAIVLDNIYYDFDRAEIRPDAALELDKLVSILKDNPQIVIELSSHTDNRGEVTYNIDLSQRRAESAVSYIISKGIRERRITARGYGENRPIIPNATTEEEHQVNRRTEFKVTEITPEASIIEPPVEEEEEAPATEEQERLKKPEEPKKKNRGAIFDELDDGTK